MKENHNISNVIVDGIIFEQQAYGGASRIFYEILPRMCDEDENLLITLLSSGSPRQTLPLHPHIKHQSLLPIDRLLQPGKFFWLQKQHIRSWVQYLYISDSTNRIWHSTYYTLPTRWKGSIVVTVLDFINERFPQSFEATFYKHFLQRKLEAILSADIVICISYATKQDAYNFYNVSLDKLHVIHLASSPIFKKLNRNVAIISGRDKPFLLYIGGRSEYKNFAQLLNGYSVWQYREEVDLVVLGAAWTDVEQKELLQLGVERNVRLLGNVDDEQLCLLYNQASAFIYPSLYEGFGVPLLEAMACGCPIVASRIPSTLEIAQDCPIYFDLPDTDSLLTAFDKALVEGRNSERAELGLDLVKSFSWEKTARQTLDLYKSLQ